jgi:hypothetical protein
VSLSTVTVVELCSLPILVGYVLCQRAGERRGVLRDALWIGLSALLGEASCMALYQVYGYAPDWTLRVMGMPLLVACIWPAVVLSAEQVLRALGGRATPAAVAAMVFFDATLVEAVASRVGLWRWVEGGVFDVPLVGLVGWAAFGGAASWVRSRTDSPWVRVAFPVAWTHLVILASWWGLLRWGVRAPVPGPWLVGAVVLASAGICAWVWPRRFTVPLGVMAPRAAGAALFFALLWAGARTDPWLVAFAAGFAPPYLLATRWRRRPPPDAVVPGTLVGPPPG